MPDDLLWWAEAGMPPDLLRLPSIRALKAQRPAVPELGHAVDRSAL
jgi:hypothetical protein